METSATARILRAAAPLLALVALSILIALADPNFVETRSLVRIANATDVPLNLSMALTLAILGSIGLQVEGAVAVSAMTVVLLAHDDVHGHDAGLAAVL